MLTAPFVPSNRKKTQKMIELAELKPNFVVYELGCGDARIIRLAAAQGVKKAVGFDVSIPLIWYGKFLSLVLRNPAKIQWKNIWNQDYADADVIFCYLLPMAMARMEEEIWPQLKVGAKIISNSFILPHIKAEKNDDGVFVYTKSEVESLKSKA